MPVPAVRIREESQGEMSAVFFLLILAAFVVYEMIVG
jgi:hypothetical protein